jgi:hypothetical protein
VVDQGVRFGAIARQHDGGHSMRFGVQVHCYNSF